MRLLRKQAVDWLHADLALWTKQLDGKSTTPVALQQTLQQWHGNPDLAGLRDQDALAGLPPDERQACQKLWDDVNSLRARLNHESYESNE